MNIRRQTLKYDDISKPLSSMPWAWFRQRKIKLNSQLHGELNKNLLNVKAVSLDHDCIIYTFHM